MALVRGSRPRLGSCQPHGHDMGWPGSVRTKRNAYLERLGLSDWGARVAAVMVAL